ncbi:MBL fold metallo-hydrolase [Actinacidiphila sp. ITFR-21]|uniref:MBL fold metallo-hydrolase n=1 Tax=Actinacidiphila sp. ITFR-21 TaxID=3075199 RepID=UPI00288A1CB9|nr:MBL fold metallo-hydrolase [Streptomyces sp. ITFR-21]WNI19013.1 MBL fold metallo-hydrolase [Streptomyces sp. ITFR-21]
MSGGAGSATSRHDWTLPGLYEVADGVFRIPLPLPNDGLRAVNVYVVVDGGQLVLVDSGWALDAAVTELELRLKQLGFSGEAITRVLVTHAHRDHYTLATRLRRRYGSALALGAGERHYLRAVRDGSAQATRAARLRAHGATDLADRAARPAPRPDLAEWADPDDWLTAPGTVALRERELAVVATPGHTRGHVVFADHRHGLLFAGDHVLPHITPSLSVEPEPAALPLRDYLRSLRLTKTLPEMRLLPGHGPVTAGFHDRVDELLAHHDRRLRAALDVVRDRAGATTANTVATLLPWTRHNRTFAQLDPGNRTLAVLETAVHLDVLVEDGLLTTADRLGVRYYEPAGPHRPTTGED